MVATNINKKLVHNVDIKVFNDSLGDSRMNMTTALDSDLTSLVFSTELKAKPIQNEEFRSLLRLNFDFCDVQRNVLGKMIFDFFEEFLGQHSNFQLKCPIKKGFYYLSRFPLLNTTWFPAFIWKVDAHYIVTISVRGKVKGAKTLNKIMNLFVNGSVYWWNFV